SSTIKTHVKDAAPTPVAATHWPPPLFSFSASRRAHTPNPSANSCGTNDSKPRMRTASLSGFHSTRHIVNGPAISEITRLAVANVDAVGGSSWRRELKFLHGPHISLPWNFTRQSAQKPCSHSVHVSSFGRR